MSVRVYNPIVEVRIIKAIKRVGDAAGYDVTSHLGENGFVRVDKSTRDMAGGFSIQLADKAPGALDTVYALVEPMDLVDIRFCHDGDEYSGKPPVVMRGLVSSVSRGEAMGSGKPYRTVTISGQDWGKILHTLMIYYLNNSTLNEYHISEYQFFHKYFPNSEIKNMTAVEFLGLVVQNIINPYMAKITKFANGAPLDATVINAMTPKASIRGLVSPYALSTFADTSLHAMLRTLLDVGAFNEMYVFDGPSDIQLVVRPQPFRPYGSKSFIQDGAWADEIGIDHVDLVSLSPSRSDASIANYYWVSNSRWAFMDNMTMKEIAMQGSRDTFLSDTHFNSNIDYFGFRKLEVDSVLLPEAFSPKSPGAIPNYSGSDSTKKDVQPNDRESVNKWLDWRRYCLNRMNRDNLIFESGSMVLRGNEKIKAGMYINLDRNGFVVPYYGFRVSHTVRPFRDFLTTVTFDRGEGFIKRVGASGTYEGELSRRGA